MVADLQICIIMDFHHPADLYVHSLKDYIEEAIIDVKSKYPTKSIEVAFVAYGGYWCVPYTKVWDFTTNIAKLQKELKTFKLQHQLPSLCRNVQQAYGLANDMKWTGRKQIIFHMGLGPAFGPNYHSPDFPDLYPKGHPYLVLEEEVEKFAQKNIDLVLLKLDSHWDIMVSVIKVSYMTYRYQGFSVEDLSGKSHIICNVVYDTFLKHLLRQFM